MLYWTANITSVSSCSGEHISEQIHTQESRFQSMFYICENLETHLNKLPCAYGFTAALLPLCCYFFERSRVCGVCSVQASAERELWGEQPSSMTSVQTILALSYLKAPQTSQDMIRFAQVLLFLSQRELTVFGHALCQ